MDCRATHQGNRLLSDGFILLLLPDRPVSPDPNLVTEAGLKDLEFQLDQAREAYETAQKIEDVM
jgi:hypothetical protein